MNKTKPNVKNTETRKLKEVKYQESPIERALKLSSDEAIAMAIRNLIKKDELN